MIFASVARGGIAVVYCQMYYVYGSGECKIDN